MPLLLDLIFWGVLVSFVLHIIDETLLGGGFAKIREHWWPEYSGTMFFWFNAEALAIMTLFIALYDLLGGA